MTAPVVDALLLPGSTPPPPQMGPGPPAVPQGCTVRHPGLLHRPPPPPPWPARQPHQPAPADNHTRATCGWTWIRQHSGAAILCLLHHPEPHQQGRPGHPLKPLGRRVSLNPQWGALCRCLALGMLLLCALLARKVPQMLVGYNVLQFYIQLQIKLDENYLELVDKSTRRASISREYIEAGNGMKINNTKM